MALRAAILALSLAAPALAQPLDGAAFDAQTDGRTFTFFADGTAYGQETYLPGNRVIWTFLDGQCKQGDWYERTMEGRPAICFVYDDDGPGDPPQCWHFDAQGGDMTVRFVPFNGTRYKAALSQTAVVCDNFGF
ncbi:MAG: hypothetical protein ACU0BF_10985 [Paracoccaceae bacterium]